LDGRGGRPLVGEDRHHGGVDPVTVVAQRVAQHAFRDEADLLIDASGTRVEGVDLQRDPMQAEPLEAISDDQACCLGAQPSVATGWPEDRAEVAALVVLVPLVEDHLAHALAALFVHDCQVESIALLVAGVVPVAHPYLTGRVPGCGVSFAGRAAGKHEGLRIPQCGADVGDVLRNEWAQQSLLTGEGGLDG